MLSLKSWKRLTFCGKHSEPAANVSGAKESSFVRSSGRDARMATWPRATAG
jgi:hypothetical protein